MSLRFPAIAVLIACRSTEPDPGLGSVAHVFAEIDTVCALGETVERSPHGELWSEAKKCSLDPFAPMNVGCQAQVTKFPERRAVMEVEIACIDIDALASAGHLGLLAQALNVKVPWMTLAAVVHDPNPRQSLQISWSDGRTVLRYYRDSSGHVQFSVQIDTTRTGRFERKEGLEAEGL